jgi:AraC-like DNA-binding protein
MRPLYEQVHVPLGDSFALLWRELPEIPFEWHYHPEYELTLNLNARGQRYVGDHLGVFESGDLVLLGPNLAHTWSARERLDAGRPMLAVVVWFSDRWLQDLLRVLPELAALQRLTQLAQAGYQFSPAVAAQVQADLLALKVLSPPERLPVLLRILLALSQEREGTALSQRLAHGINDAGRERLAKALEQIHAQWHSPPPIAALAATASLSVGAFHRFFKRHTGRTVMDYIAQLRIGQACQRLIETELPIGLVAAQAGYLNLAHFNRQFKKLRGTTPRELRARYRPASRL